MYLDKRCNKWFCLVHFELPATVILTEKQATASCSETFRELIARSWISPGWARKSQSHVFFIDLARANPSWQTAEPILAPIVDCPPKIQASERNLDDILPVLCHHPKSCPGLMFSIPQSSHCYNHTATLNLLHLEKVKKIKDQIAWDLMNEQFEAFISTICFFH